MEINNETLGMSAEKVICDIYNLDCSNIKHRSYKPFESKLVEELKKAVLKIPKIISYEGKNKGLRGGQSKSTIDFKMVGNKTLSVKTTNGTGMLCPSECGQPGTDTFDKYFGHLYNGKIDPDKARKLVIKKIDQMLPIYFEHLFDNDFLLFIHLPFKGGRDGKELIFPKEDEPPGTHIFDKTDLNKIKWDMKDISFTSNRVLSENDVTSLLKKKEDAEKKNLIKAVEEIKEKLKPIWVESQTIKHKGVSVAEFQIHRHRKSYKFRFNMFNLRKLL